MKILSDKSGNLYKVHDGDAALITEDDRQKLLAEAQSEVEMLQSYTPAPANPSPEATTQPEQSTAQPQLEQDAVPPLQ